MPLDWMLKAWMPKDQMRTSWMQILLLRPTLLLLRLLSRDSRQVHAKKHWSKATGCCKTSNTCACALAVSCPLTPSCIVTSSAAFHASTTGGLACNTTGWKSKLRDWMQGD